MNESIEYIIDRYNRLVEEAKQCKKELALAKLNEALKIYEKYKKDFGVGNQNLDVELREMMEAWEKGKTWIENNKDWGKEYYEDDSLKAEWSNKDYMKCGDYTKYYKNGNIEMKCKYLDELNRDGFMHKYFEDGKLKELWSYDKGERIFIKKYYPNGNIKKEWNYKKGGETEIIDYTKDGNKKNKSLNG